MAVVSKATVGKPTGGSNPSISALCVGSMPTDLGNG